MRLRQRFGIVAVLAALMLCAKAPAQVLDQAPAHAVGFFEVRDLGALSNSVAKFAKTLGLDQMEPRFADPLGSLQEQFGVKEGLNKNGDMAVFFFEPKDDAKSRKKSDDAAEAPGGDQPPPTVVFIPVSDYKAFLGNFQDAKSVGGGITQVTVPKDKETLFVVQRGHYAAAAMDKALLGPAAGGMKLQGQAASELKAKDVLLYVDIKALRPRIQREMEKGRKMMDDQQKNAGAGAPNPFNTPEMKQMMDAYAKLGEQFVQQTNSATFGFSLGDNGISTSALGEFDPKSDWGKMMGQVKNTTEPLSAGLPGGKYFAFGGAKITPEVGKRIMSFFADAMKKQFAGKANGKDISAAFDAAQDAIAASNSMSIGYAVPSAQGESIVQAISVVHGDAQKILDAQKKALPAVSAFSNAGDQKMNVKVNFGEPKTVGDVKLQTYTMKFNFDANDPNGAQAQQMISTLYGRDGLAGAMGVVNKDTFVSAQGGVSDKLMGDLIAAAKENADALDQQGPVKKVAASLPKERSMEFYVALDNIIGEGVKFAKQQGLAVPFKLPPNLPPIGVTAGAEESTVRMDSFIPTQLIQSITAAGMQAWMQMNGGPGAQGGGQGGGI